MCVFSESLPVWKLILTSWKSENTCRHFTEQAATSAMGLHHHPPSLQSLTLNVDTQLDNLLCLTMFVLILLPFGATAITQFPGKTFTDKSSKFYKFHICRKNTLQYIRTSFKLAAWSYIGWQLQPFSMKPQDTIANRFQGASPSPNRFPCPLLPLYQAGSA